MSSKSSSPAIVLDERRGFAAGEQAVEILFFLQIDHRANGLVEQARNRPAMSRPSSGVAWLNDRQALGMGWSRPLQAARARSSRCLTSVWLAITCAVVADVDADSTGAGGSAG